MSWDAAEGAQRPGNYGGRGLQDAARRGTEGLVRDGGASRGPQGCDLVVRGSGTSPGEKGRVARVWKEDWTLVRDGDRRGWTRAACGRFERVTLGAGGGRARPEFCWNAEKGGLGTGTCGWAQVTETVRDSRMVWGESDGAGDGTRSRAQNSFVGSFPRWEGKDRGVEHLHRGRRCAPGPCPPSGPRGAERFRGFAELEPAEGSRGRALQDRRAHPSLSWF